MAALTNHFASRRQVLQFLTYIILFIACAALMLQYASNLSVWRDEAALANNIIERDYEGLLQPLSYEQAAPIGFLLLTETVTQFLGTSEYALRLLPLIFGLLTIVFFFQLGKLIDPSALIFGLALLTTSSLHLRYSAEFKQYIGDSFWAVCLMYPAFLYLNHQRKRELILLALAGCISVWFSHPAIFVLAGIGTVLVIYLLGKREYRSVVQLVGAGILWLTSFAVVYLVSYRNVVTGTELASFMNSYWESDFLTLNAASFIRAVLEIFIWVGGLFQPMMLILVIFGLVLGIRRLKRLYSALLLMPIVFMFIASLLELYPITNRMILFLMPSLMLIVGVGWWQVINAIFSQHSKAGWVFLIAALAGVLLRLQIPFTTTDTTQAREALAWIHTIDEDPPLFLTTRFTAIARYYGYEWDHFSDEKPEQLRYWIVTDAPPPSGTIPETPHTVYNFRETTVICSPSADMRCPADKN